MITACLQDPNDNSMLDMLIGYSCIQSRILLLLLLLLLRVFITDMLYFFRNFAQFILIKFYSNVFTSSRIIHGRR